MIRRIFLILWLLAPAGIARGQGPIFLSPPNTMPQRNFGPSFNYVKKGFETDVSAGVMYGLLPRFTVGLSTTMIQDGSEPFRAGRVQVQAKARLYEKVGDGRRAVLGVTAGYGLPLSSSIADVARINGVSNVVVSMTGSKVNRRTGLFAGAQYTLDAHYGGNRPTGTWGAAFSWRLKAAHPGATGGPGFTFFGEGLGHYEADHSGWLALGPGVIYRFGRTQLKLGTRIPVIRWNSHSKVMLSAGTSMFIPL